MLGVQIKSNYRQCGPSASLRKDTGDTDGYLMFFLLLSAFWKPRQWVRSREKIWDLTWDFSFFTSGLCFSGKITRPSQILTWGKIRPHMVTKGLQVCLRSYSSSQRNFTDSDSFDCWLCSFLLLFKDRVCFFYSLMWVTQIKQIREWTWVKVEAPPFEHLKLDVN